MKLVLLVGNGAVGKMTVGQELMKQTGLRMFHNHMTIEPVLDIFGKFDIETIFALRDVIFERFSQSDAYGMIFTFMWAFDSPADWAYVAHIKDKKCPAGVCKDLVSYVVVEDKCKGCTKCARNCPVNAISGSVKNPHVIDTAKCIKCGACMENCPFGAIVKE